MVMFIGRATMTYLSFVWIVEAIVGFICLRFALLGHSQSFPFVDGFALNAPRVITTKLMKNNIDIPSSFSIDGLTTTSLTVASFSTAAANSDDDAAKSSDPTKPLTTPSLKKKKTWKELRKEGGPLTIGTPIGALNPFALWYFFVSVTLGIPLYIVCKLCQFLYWITGNRFDPKRRIPIFTAHCWGMALLRLTKCYPTIKNEEIVTNFFKKKKEGKDQNAMFVANHCSWMDIPFLGATMGWRNYKIVSKKELGIVPILGTTIRVGGHIMVDRVDRRSQIKTLKQGIGYLKKDGINLATFPEGTRSRSGRLLKFKAGAFKMAHKAGAPVFPISIVNSHKVMPTGWMMAMRPAHGLAEVIIHPPISSDDKTEEELVEAVRKSMIEGLPEDQKPLR